MKHDKKLKWLVTVFKVRKWSFFESFRSLTQSKRVCECGTVKFFKVRRYSHKKVEKILCSIAEAWPFFSKAFEDFVTVRYIYVGEICLCG